MCGAGENKHKKLNRLEEAFVYVKSGTMRYLCAFVLGLGLLGGVLTCAGIAIQIQVHDLPNARDQLARVNDSRVILIRYMYIQPEFLTEAVLTSNTLKCKGKLNVTDITTGRNINNQTYTIKCGNLRYLFDKVFIGYLNWDNKVITPIHPRKLYSSNIYKKETLRDSLGMVVLIVLGITILTAICMCMRYKSVSKSLV